MNSWWSPAIHDFVEALESHLGKMGLGSKAVCRPIFYENFKNSEFMGAPARPTPEPGKIMNSSSSPRIDKVIH